MARGQRTPADVRRRIQQYVEEEGLSPAEIEPKLIEEFGGRAPSTRTIQGQARKYLPPPDESGDWSIAGRVELRHPDQVVAALAAEREHSGWFARGLTNGEAEMLDKLVAAAPGIPPWEALRLARAYRARRDAGRPTRDLDLYVAFTPWHDRGERYVAAYRDHHIEDDDLWPGESAEGLGRAMSDRRLEDDRAAGRAIDLPTPEEVNSMAISPAARRVARRVVAAHRPKEEQR